MSELYVALLHHPVYDKDRNVVTSAVTNIDVHDIARSCRSYGARAFYVVTPVDALRGLVRRILRHWEEGSRPHYNPTRVEALALVRLERSLEGVLIDIERTHGQMPTVVGTTARHTDESIGYAELRREMEAAETPCLVLLGTSWGLSDETLASAHHVLAPIVGPTRYNHLSVRAAAAVILDRLRGTG